MTKEFGISDILSAVNSIAGIEKKKAKTIEKKVVRDELLKSGKRIDGRDNKTVRSINNNISEPSDPEKRPIVIIKEYT